MGDTIIRILLLALLTLIALTPTSSAVISELPQQQYFVKDIYVVVKDEKGLPSYL